MNTKLKGCRLKRNLIRQRILGKTLIFRIQTIFQKSFWPLLNLFSSAAQRSAGLGLKLRLDPGFREMKLLAFLQRGRLTVIVCWSQGKCFHRNYCRGSSPAQPSPAQAILHKTWSKVVHDQDNNGYLVSLHLNNLNINGILRWGFNFALKLI